MLSNVRWRIALWFIGLSTAAYIVPTALALFIFYVSLTASIDRELDGFIASFGHAITVIEGKPVLRDWARIVQTNPAHSLVTYQLFDRDGNLLEAHFPPGIPKLFRNVSEVRSGRMTMRTRMTPLNTDGQTVGYLQVQLPTNARDDAIKQLALIIVVISPVVLIGLGLSSYLVSEKATLQTRRTLSMLRQFVADASHELYTPLSIVQAAHESLARVVDPGGTGATEFEISESALERMEHMLDDLMLLSTMETPDRKQNLQSLDLGLLLQDVIGEFRTKFDHKSVSLSSAIAQPMEIQGDRPALHRLFANLIENAWRYTSTGGNVAIECAIDGNTARVTVSDNGIGIPAESLPHVFDRFYRVDSSRSRSSGGSGLGLAIAVAIAQAHGGAIQVASEQGKGSKFKVILPIDKSLEKKA